jgi:hypothetical protein
LSDNKRNGKNKYLQGFVKTCSKHGYGVDIKYFRSNFEICLDLFAFFQIWIYLDKKRKLLLNTTFELVERREVGRSKEESSFLK